ncbi:MAG: DsbA family protein [Chloroflexi bacterium]|nr:DsbA family protein [Chloroflexota bacterium]
MRLHQVQQRLGERFTLSPRAYPLFPSDRPARLLSPHGMLSRLRAGLQAERDGLACRAWPETQPTPRSSLPALAAAKCARLQGADAFQRFDLALYRAYFAQCRDISDQETLVQIAEEVGLERAPFLAALESGAPQAQVLADYEDYRRRYGPASPGIPLLEVDGRVVVGSAATEVYERVILEGLQGGAAGEPPGRPEVSPQEQAVETSVSTEFVDFQQRLEFLWEETTWKAAAYQARARVAQRQGYAEIGEVLAQAARLEGRYASVLAEMLFADYIKDTSYNVERTIEREADTSAQSQLIALAAQMGLDPVAQLLDQLVAHRLATAGRLRDLWATTASGQHHGDE